MNPTLPKEKNQKGRSKPKARIYIDGANVFYTQKDQGWTIDWVKTIKFLKQRWEVVDIKYYTGLRTNDNKMRSYLKYLDAIGITPITKPLKKIKTNKGFIFKSNFDVEMTTDILLERSGIDDIILFTGDSDFHSLVKRLKDFGKKVVVFSSRKMIAWELKLSVSEYIFIEDLQKKITKNKNLHPKVE